MMMDVKTSVAPVTYTEHFSITNILWSQVVIILRSHCRCFQVEKYLLAIAIAF